MTVLGIKLQNPAKNFTCTHRQQEPVALMEVGTDDPEIPLPSFKSNLGGMYIMMQCTVPSSALCHVCTTTTRLHSVYIVPILPATSLGVLLGNIVAISGHRLQWPTGLKNVQQHFVSARKRVLNLQLLMRRMGLNHY